MCNVTYYKSKKCKHTWLTITEPCGPYKGFDNCELFEDGKMRMEHPKQKWAPDYQCPYHDFKGFYDTNRTQVVDKVKLGVKLGPNASNDSPGPELPCIIL